MLDKLICPFCYERFTKSEILFRCQSTDDKTCPKENDAKLAQYFGNSSYPAKHIIPNDDWATSKSKGIRGLGKKALSLAVVPKEKKCDKCRSISRKRVCPCCHNQLPTNFHQAKGHIISIIGARGSGKTHFITVLIHELKRRGYRLKIKITPQDVGEDRNNVTSQKYKREYYGPLIEKGEELPKTAVSNADYPLIYEIDSDKKSMLKNEVLYLTFYDTAGENFYDEEDMRKLASYVKNSSGIIFLLDTFEIPVVRKELQKRGVNIGSSSGVHFSDILDRLEGLLKAENIIKHKKKANIPLAVSFSKIDEIIKNDLFKKDGIKCSIENLGEKSQYWKNEEYSEPEIEEVSREMRSLLHLWGERPFYENVERVFSRVKYFAVSALGETPEHGKLHGDGVNPHRVTDPLIWILDQLNFSLPKAKPPKS